ncbi:hypothetical protein B0H15DRAFT_778458 [Mycena belliarum]|uniref:Uncharacterized protein n=1 Tax=Mycena belliarum TaxID=1033014 RepID=A0AAD6U7S3_9AGAR|nr:hypothetical protein B0H15DRAFT_778458 [Mycena belliae]
MAFKDGLKRFFSIGRRKTKSKKRFHVVPSAPLHPISESGPLPDDSGEVTANQLLRSSSTRYAVVNECDYASLPPLPHPINSVLQTPASSTVSLSSATTSINSTTRGTYTVKVHSRTHHAHTEFPNANRGIDNEPEPAQRNNSQLLGLRSDPSVASLLDLYDEHGRLPARTFSNSPPSVKGKSSEGRAQVQRNGSTLRQLLGNPSSSVNSQNTAFEGDISWAERFLGETASLASASTSSFGLSTPDTDSHSPPTHLHLNLDNSFITDDLSSNMSGDPAISSLDVELSDITESPPRASRSPYVIQDPKTPQRASQVFGFLIDKRRSRAPEDDERSLPDLPSAFSSPSDEASPPARGRSRSHFSSDSSADSIDPTGSAPAPPLPVTPTEDRFLPVDPPPRANDVHVIMAHGPTKVIVTAPTPSYHDNIAARVPRGPRSHHRQRKGNDRERQADPFTTIPARRHVSRRSSTSSSASLAERAEPPQVKPATKDKGKRRSILAVFEKENHLTAKQELPRTPIRAGSISRPYQRGVAHRVPVSPASSLELSEASRQLMGDLRQQRLRAREQDRRRVPRVYI